MSYINTAPNDNVANNPSAERGYVQVYTGNGKGKTTAAFGLALRAAGAGKKVFIAQFVKGMVYSEVRALEAFAPQITIKQYGRDCFIHRTPTQEDIDMARHGIDEVKAIIQSGRYHMVILDEANIATFYNLFSVEELIEAISQHCSTEIVVTGRYAEQKLLDYADLVTEMEEIKHYYHQGVAARKGIEC